ncbi:hypothetical protein BsWGS_16456 [Bradybaena similaris]
MALSHFSLNQESQDSKMKVSYETMASVRTLHIVMLTGIMGILQTMGQICPYTDPGCSCDGDWMIRCFFLQQIPPLNRGANVSHLPHLSLENGNITSIASNSLPSGLTGFFSSGNPLTNISDDVFDNSADTLEIVSISGAKFSKLPTALKKLTKLRELALLDAEIQLWDASTVKNFAATLEILYLINVGLSAWPSWISDFQLLRTLDLSDNSLKSIPDDAFSTIKDTLTYLKLSRTGLTEIRQALSTLTSLIDLVLPGNNFTDVSEVESITMFPFAQKLSYLRLDAVGFTRIANVSKLTSLSSISLDYNSISGVPVGFLPLSLTSLSISNNILSSVPKDAARMSKLETLTLDHNLITEIEPSAFPISLTDLDLSFNNLTTITNTSFKNLNLLRILALYNNPITTISYLAFSDLVSLEHLYISGSHLTEIPLAFTRLSSKTDITFSTTQPLSCPCPAPNDLVQWFTSLTNTTSLGILYLTMIDCSNGQRVVTYLRGQCG